MDSIRQFLTQFSGPEAYAIYYFTLLGCGIGMPMNSDLVLITASMLAALGMFKLSILIPIAFLGLLSGDTINFFVARRFGPEILRRRPMKWILSETKVRNAEKFLAEKGNGFLFCVRFLPLIRTVLYFTAGSLKVSPRTFYVLNGISTAIYLVILMNLAYRAGENIDVLIANFKRFQLVLLLAFSAAVTHLWLRRRRRRATTA
jgi:membrane protein DedA with SNARE-associated domain